MRRQRRQSFDDGHQLAKAMRREEEIQPSLIVLLLQRSCCVGSIESCVEPIAFGVCHRSLGGAPVGRRNRQVTAHLSRLLGAHALIPRPETRDCAPKRETGRDDGAGHSVTVAMRQIEDRYRSKSHEVTLDERRRRPLARRHIDKVVRLTSLCTSDFYRAGTTSGSPNSSNSVVSKKVLTCTTRLPLNVSTWS